MYIDARRRRDLFLDILGCTAGTKVYNVYRLAPQVRKLFGITERYKGFLDKSAPQAKIFLSEK